MTAPNASRANSLSSACGISRITSRQCSTFRSTVGLKNGTRERNPGGGTDRGAGKQERTSSPTVNA